MTVKQWIIAIAVLVLAVCAAPAKAQVASEDEALSVAENWIQLILAKEGQWAGSSTAKVEYVEAFKRGDRILGYFCKVSPRGFIIVSLRRELAPVKAYSDENDLDPSSDEGLADLLKTAMERVLNAIEKQLGPVEAIATETLAQTLEVDYRESWNELLAPPPGPGKELEFEAANYQEGQVLLSSAWHQHDPYNEDCPWLGCSNTDNGRAVVGCVATAGAQIMRYWAWPPYGSGSPYSDSYDWPNMPDRATTSSPAAVIDAVAELSHEVGLAAHMDYGCSGSGAFPDDMEDAYEDHFRYSTACVKRDRSDYSAVDWFNLIKSQCNANRPVQYYIPKHSIVCDGWKEIGSTPLRQYHMNYGWGTAGDNTWYTLDALQGGNPDEELLQKNIYPATALGSSFNGTYAKASFPYRYFDRDATSSSGATFESGQFLQFLPNVTVTCTSATGGTIRLEGDDTDPTRLFTRGDPSRGARIYGGAIKIHRNGSLTLQ